MKNVKTFSLTIGIPVALVAGALLLLTEISTGTAAEKTPAVGKTAADFDLEELGGDNVKLSNLTKEGQVVLVVLRGFPGYQCPACNLQFSQFLEKAEAFKKAGVQVVFVYPGPSDKLKKRADEFVKGRDYPNHFQFLLDPDYIFTNAYGLRWDAKNETAYPSTFVISKEKKIVFAKISKTHGGRAAVKNVLKAVNGN